MLLTIVVNTFSFLLHELKFDIMPVVLNMILNSLIRAGFHGSVMVSDGSLSVFMAQPFDLLFLTLTILSVKVFFCGTTGSEGGRGARLSWGKISSRMLC